MIDVWFDTVNRRIEKSKRRSGKILKQAITYTLRARGEGLEEEKGEGEGEGEGEGKGERGRVRERENGFILAV